MFIERKISLGYRFQDRFNDEPRNLESFMKFVSEWGERNFVSRYIKGHPAQEVL